MLGRAIAIITARGGSKRVPRKNIKPFMGRPMLAYAVDAALKSGLFEEVMVSTEDAEIADVAKSCGAAVPFFRSTATADDHATTYDVLREVMDTYGRMGRTFDTICCIYPCVPFLKAETLVEASKAMSSADAVVPVCKYPVPIEWAMKIEDGILYPLDRAAQMIRSQDLTPKYYDVGMFYFIRAAAFEAEGTMQSKRTTAFVISELECQDIDTPDDWRMAEMKYRILNGNA